MSWNLSYREWEILAQTEIRLSYAHVRYISHGCGRISMDENCDGVLGLEVVSGLA